MNPSSETLIQELKELLKPLKIMEQRNATILNFLPKELKIALKAASEKVKEAAVAVEGVKSSELDEDVVDINNAPKDKCAMMLQNWEDFIITPFRQEVAALAASGASGLYNSVDALAQKYYKKYSKKNWFDPQDNKANDNYMESIRVSPITRRVVLKREMAMEDGQLVFVDGQPVETPSTLSGPIATATTAFVGINDIAEIVVPSTTAQKLVVGGNISFTLNCLSESDTFIIKDASNRKLYEYDSKKGDVKTDSFSFEAVPGNLFVEVEESTNTSQWEASIVFSFILIEFKVPECRKELPCPKW